MWKAADKLHKNIDVAEYKHIVLGLIFLKYISDALMPCMKSSGRVKATMPGPTRIRPDLQSECLEIKGF
ncbi:type I restriction-modification system subunit M N-terminal domain-containing protein [Desulfobotulus pelophilus]|uniref:type I restriction-modification system subunit M N-terminal domain-containing protein n=1 Tax=Desulfobotulus pelophilus TaxID=2823377 RepID=UPI0034A4CA15